LLASRQEQLRNVATMAWRRNREPLGVGPAASEDSATIATCARAQLPTGDQQLEGYNARFKRLGPKNKHAAVDVVATLAFEEQCYWQRVVQVYSFGGY
jgi:hypothetical protein